MEPPWFLAVDVGERQVPEYLMPAAVLGDFG
jgi:hypothetical protein